MKRNKNYGLSKTRIGRIFYGMHKRCENPKSAGYVWYGGRGIKVCEQWTGEQGLLNFYNWSINNGYADNLSIDRINHEENYEPSNCRWADAITQANNTRWNVFLEYNGEKHTFAEWGRTRNIKAVTLFNRINRYGWSIGEALEYEPRKTPHHSEVLYTINGETHNVAEWCKIRGISKETVRYRRENNWSPEEIFGFKERIKC